MAGIAHILEIIYEYFYFDIYQNISYDGIEMSWTVFFSGKAEKKLRGLREAEQRKARALASAIELMGPVQGGWPHYSKLGKDEHHCHLSYRYVMVWRVVDQKTKVVEITYVGSREKAPY